MTQFYIIEIRQYANVEYEHLVHYAYDENAQQAQLKAESRYHEILAAAAVSATACHAAILFTTEGFPLMHQCYKHTLLQPPVPAAEGDPEDGGAPAAESADEA